MARKTTSGDQPVTLVPVDLAAKSCMTLRKGLAVGRLLVPQAVIAVVFPNSGTWYLLSITRIKTDGALYYLAVDGAWLWQPNTWNEVLTAFVPKVMEQLTGTLQTSFKPVMDNLKTLTTSNVERQLTEIDPQWRTYEDNITDTLKEHPTLANNVGRLYRISVPEEVLTARATQTALKKFETKAASAKIQGKSSIQSSTEPTNQKLTFDQAVEKAKRDLGQ